MILLTNTCPAAHLMVQPIPLMGSLMRVTRFRPGEREWEGGGRGERGRKREEGGRGEERNEQGRGGKERKGGWRREERRKKYQKEGVQLLMDIKGIKEEERKGGGNFKTDRKLIKSPLKGILQATPWQQY